MRGRPRRPLHEEITQLRKKRGLSQRELGLLSGVAQPHIAKIERSGTVNLPTLARILDALHAELVIVPRGKGDLSRNGRR